MSSLRDQPTLPLGEATCGYCLQPMSGPSCQRCAPELAEISTMGQWEDFMTRKLRNQRRRNR